jgi:hypothetical protein
MTPVPQGEISELELSIVRTEIGLMLLDLAPVVAELPANDQGGA